MGSMDRMVSFLGFKPFPKYKYQASHKRVFVGHLWSEFLGVLGELFGIQNIQFEKNNTF